MLGNTVNTNASWMAAQITRLGGKVTRITTVADNLNEIARSVNEALRRKPNFLITTGGIGPTFDDMTLRGVAKALRLRITLNKAAVQMMRAHYSRRFPGRRITFTKPRLKMASIPATSVPVINPVGSAPAVRLTVRGTEIFCLPGVPHEARAIFENTISKIVNAEASGTIFVEKWVRVQGVMESSLAPIIDRVMRRWPRVYVKSHPRSIRLSGQPKLDLHFSTTSTSPISARRSVFGAVEDLRKQLEPYDARITFLA